MAKKGEQWRHEGDYPSKERDVYPSEEQTLLQRHQYQRLCVCARIRAGSISRLSLHILRFLPSVYEIKKDKENTDLTTPRQCKKNIIIRSQLKDKIAFGKN